jgi:hypothetical protein
MNDADKALCAEYTEKNGCLHDCQADHFHISGANSPYSEIRDYLIYVCECPVKLGTGQCSAADKKNKLGCWTPVLINLVTNFRGK